MYIKNKNIFLKRIFFINNKVDNLEFLFLVYNEDCSPCFHAHRIDNVCEGDLVFQGIFNTFKCEETLPTFCHINGFSFSFIVFNLEFHSQRLLNAPQIRICRKTMFHQQSPLEISGECAPTCTLACSSVHQTYAMFTTSLKKNIQ